MSALSEKIAAKHDVTVRLQEASPPGWRQPIRRSTVYDCACGAVGLDLDSIARHLADVTETAVREAIADELDAKVVRGAGGHPYNEWSRAFESAAEAVRKGTP